MIQDSRLSYLKTVVLAAGAGTAALAASLIVSSYVKLHWLESEIVGIGAIVMILALSVAAGGMLAIYRQMRDAKGLPDLFRTLNQPRSESVIGSGRTDMGMVWARATRWLPWRPRFLVGDWVEVRSFAEIAATLDAAGMCESMPFMPEMQRFCGRRARIFRCVDKVYDYGRSKGLRRLERTYLLHQMRCDGSAHGGCQANCYLFWKESWLKHADHSAEAGARSNDRAAVPPVKLVTSSATKPFVCQFTELWQSTRQMSPRDLRQDLRPLFSGNVTWRAFIVASLTQLFNWVQQHRRGAGYPHFQHGVLTSTPAVNHALEAGDRVRVLDPTGIWRTLDKSNKNRGLWFDLDMLKHCSKDYEVLARVYRIIDNVTGEMREMKSPCIVLQGVDYSGEPLRLCMQEEHLYWREAWLAPIDKSDVTKVIVKQRQMPQHAGMENG